VRVAGDVSIRRAGLGDVAAVCDFGAAHIRAHYEPLLGESAASRQMRDIYKLYVHPEWRGRGVGPLLLDAVIATMPTHATHVEIEHFAANERAARFCDRQGYRVYDRQGYRVDHVSADPSGDPALAIVWRTKALE
jgi:GNAT superfamily N-acetyltransferase